MLNLKNSITKILDNLKIFLVFKVYQKGACGKGHWTSYNYG